MSLAASPRCVLHPAWSICKQLPPTKEAAMETGGREMSVEMRLGLIHTRIDIVFLALQAFPHREKAVEPRVGGVVQARKRTGTKVELRTARRAIGQNLLPSHACRLGLTLEGGEEAAAKA